MSEAAIMPTPDVLEQQQERSHSTESPERRKWYSKALSFFHKGGYRAATIELAQIPDTDLRVVDAAIPNEDLRSIDQAKLSKAEQARRLMVDVVNPKKNPAMYVGLGLIALKFVGEGIDAGALAQGAELAGNGLLGGMLANTAAGKAGVESKWQKAAIITSGAVGGAVALEPVIGLAKNAVHAGVEQVPIDKIPTPNLPRPDVSLPSVSIPAPEVARRVAGKVLGRSGKVALEAAKQNADDVVMAVATKGAND